MSLKERLFGPPWESKDPEARAKAVATTNDRRLFARLPAIAKQDTDPKVRLAALKRLGDESAWLEARRAETDPAIRAGADQFLMRASCENAAPDRVDGRLAWLESLDSGDALRKIAASAADTGMRRAALARINSPGFLGDCVVSEPDDATATEVLARIEQVSTLKRIATKLKKKHKTRHQAVIQRLAELEGGTEVHDARDELAIQLIAQAEKLARGASSADRKTQAEQLAARWQELTDPEPHLARRFHGAMRIVESALVPRQKAEAQEPAEPVPAPADPELEQVTESAQKLAAQPTGEKTAGALNRMISTFDRRWNALRSPGPADLALQERFRALAGELQARIEIQAHPKTRPSADSPGKDQPDSGLENALEQALTEADQALESGDIAKSHEAIRKARSLHDKMPGKQRSRDTGGRLARMAGKLKEMRDWQHWSNNKLRERLIERVGEIDAENLHPDAVTERLKELRQRWKELDEQEVLPGDKRQFAAPQGQWRKFQRACKEAFDAARPYLEKRSEVREQSHQELQDFLTDARQVAADPDTPNDKLIRYQRAAREAIRNLDTLPPKLRGKSASALRELMDTISAALDRHFEDIENEKRRLVAEARKLAHEKDRALAVDRAKSLQADWKKAGRGRRKIDDQLWQEFREPIDPLFEGLKAEREERKQVEHQHAEALKQLCERAEVLAENEDPGSVAGQLAGLEEEFNQHSSAPPALRKRFEQALNRYQQQLKAARDARAQAKLAHLVSMGEQLQDTWQRLLAGKKLPAAGELPEISQQDETGMRLRDRLENMLAATDADELRPDVEALTARARQIVIEMECLSGLESPEEDRKLRMDYQINRLSSRLVEGAPKADLDSERAELQRRWLESFPHDPEQNSQLVKRFENADKILKQMTAS